MKFPCVHEIHFTENIPKNLTKNVMDNTLISLKCTFCCWMEMVFIHFEYLASGFVSTFPHKCYSKEFSTLKKFAPRTVFFFYSLHNLCPHWNVRSVNTHGIDISSMQFIIAISWGTGERFLSLVSNECDEYSLKKKNRDKWCAKTMCISTFSECFFFFCFFTCMR